MTTTTDLEACASRARAALARRRVSEREWIESTLDLALALYEARRLKGADVAFGQWCEASGLGLTVINHNDRAGLVRIGADVPYWRERIAKSESRSIPRIVANDTPPPQVSPARIPPRHTTKPGPKPAAPKVQYGPKRIAEGRKIVEANERAEMVDHLAGEDEDEPVLDPMRQHTPVEPGSILPPKTVPDPDGNENDASDYNQLDPYDFGWYADNLFQAIWRAGLTTNSRDSKLFIHDRAKAVAWFADMLAEHDKRHGGDATAPEPKPEPSASGDFYSAMREINRLGKTRL